MSAVTVTSGRNKLNSWIQNMLLWIMAFFCVEQIGQIVPSILVLALVGFGYYPVVDLIFPVSTEGDREFVPEYLGLKKPYLPLLLAICGLAISAMLIFVVAPAVTKKFVWAFLGGVVLFIALHQFKLWRKVQKASFENE